VFENTLELKLETGSSMKIGSKVFAEFNNTPSSLKNKPVSCYSESNNTDYSYFKKSNSQKQTAYCGQEPNISSDIPKKSNPWSLKNITNVLGVVLGLGIIGGTILKSYKTPEAIKQLKKTAEIERRLNSLINKVEDGIPQTNKIENGTNITEKIHNLFCNLGVKANQLTEKHGDELVNNIIYGVGTVIVMPLVILFSPFGKKDSSKEDKMFAILRQPLSFLTMFSIQLAIDKMVKTLKPKVIEKNLLETKEIKVKDGLLEDYKNIEFNEKALKTHFEKFFEHTLTKKEIETIFLFNDPKEMATQLKELLKNKKLSEKTLKNINETGSDILKHYLQAKSGSKALNTGLTVASNIIISQVIGCTLLNVIYGKSMKQYQNYKKTKEINSENGQSMSMKGGDQ
jgi:hypothetical protein